MFKKLWFRLFVSLGVLLMAVSFVIITAEKLFLPAFYLNEQKTVLRLCMADLEKLDFNNTTDISETLSDLLQANSITTEIYTPAGEILYTTESTQMLDLFEHGQFSFKMMHSPLTLKSSKTYLDGSVISKGYDRRGDEYLVCQKQLASGYFAELRIQSELIRNSALTASSLVIRIILASILPSLAVIYLFTRKLTKPVSDITEITNDFASLNFSQRVTVTSDDELSKLGNSVNGMADSLEKALNDLKDANTKLTAALEEERNLDSMRKALVANVSHELKTPIAVISGYAEGLKLNINSEKRNEYCDIILDESKRMNKLVLSILELARYESGKAQYSPEVFDISEMCGNMLKVIFANSGITAENLIPKGSFVFADSMQIEEIFKAYLENALAYTNENGTVRVFANSSDGILKITVFNSGAYIPPEIMPNIWQSFYRGDTSHKRKDTNFGLGLSVVSAVCKSNGMQCGVYNLPTGVCFWFTVKLSDF